MAEINAFYIFYTPGHWYRPMCASICNKRHVDVITWFYGWTVTEKAKIYALKVT
jgi:hypothetical protein